MAVDKNLPKKKFKYSSRKLKAGLGEAVARRTILRKKSAEYLVTV